MAIAVDLASTDAAILSRIVQPDRADLTDAAARALLQFQFDRADLDRIHNLTSRNQDAELSSMEQAELASYLRISLFLDLMHARARLSLRQEADGPAS